MAKRDMHQQRRYAEHRMFLAIERLLVARTDLEKKSSSKWARAWRNISQDSSRDAVSSAPLLFTNGTVSECEIRLQPAA